MTKRERYLRALRNEPVDEIVWAPNFDYWLRVNTLENTLPEKYRGMSRNDIVRAVGGTIWNRASGCVEVMDKSIKVKDYYEGTEYVIEYETPIGSLRSVYSVTEDKDRTRFLKEHFVKDLETLKIMQYVVEGTHYEPNYEPCLQALKETGDDGVVLHQCLCVPFIQFAKTAAGYIDAFYLWTDYPEQVDKLIDAYTKSFLQAFSVLADGPADMIATGDNMDGTTISPPIFRRYAIPFYQELRKIIEPKGKIFAGHWCGRTQSLLDMVPEAGLDVVEAIVTKPMADIELTDALDLLRGEVVLQGGMPSVMVCNEGIDTDGFINFVQQTICPLKGRKGFILGMSDNVPPNADFERVEMISQLIK